MEPLTTMQDPMVVQVAAPVVLVPQVVEIHHQHHLVKVTTVVPVLPTTLGLVPVVVAPVELDQIILVCLRPLTAATAVLELHHQFQVLL